MNLKDIKVVVFDLDGTLYEDTHHFDYYAERLKERLPADKRDLFTRDYLTVKKKRHPLKVGRVYDSRKDLILVEIDKQIQEAYRWNGEPLSEKEIADLYPEPIRYDFVNIISIGDPWWIPASIAGHYGLPPEKIYESFLQTRAYMIGPDFKMKPIPGLKEAIATAGRQAEIVLLTNSSEEDSIGILKKLDLTDVFSLKIFYGNKPRQTVERFEYIRDYFQVSYEEIMSIGDNWTNEIRPVKPLGCLTAFIDAYGLGVTSYADFAVSRMKELLPVITKIGQSGKGAISR